MTELTSAYEWRGRAVLDRDGDKVGKIEAIYLEHRSDEPAWALVNTGLFGSKSSFVPISDAVPRGEDVVLPITQEQVKEAPKVEADEELSAEDEAELYRHYGVDPPSAHSAHEIGDRERGRRLLRRHEAG